MSPDRPDDEVQGIVKKRAPVELTGGAGFHYENLVAARFLLDLLGGSNALGVDFGRVTRIDWQARDSGWLTDDLAIACKHSRGDRTVGLSIKRHQQVTRSGFPSDFVRTAWAQWLGIKTDRRLCDTNDAIGLVTGSLAHDVANAWSSFLPEALETTPQRMVARLSPSPAEDGSQSSALQRALFDSFACLEHLRSSGNTDKAATVALLCRVRLLHLDYHATPSRAHELALADCQNILKSGDAREAEKLWRRLNSIAEDKRPRGGSIDLPQLLALLRSEFNLREHPDYRRDWEILDKYSQDLMADVRTAIAGVPALPRPAERSAIRNRLNQSRACLLVGESGSGKSALAKDIGRTEYRRALWLSESTLDYDTATQFERGFGINHPLADILAALPDPCLVVLDGIDRYPPRALTFACHLLRDLLADAGPQHVHVLLTAQFEAASSLIARFIESGVPPSLHDATPVARPSENEIQNLLASMAPVQWASLRPELRPLLTNLKVLDWVVAAAQGGTPINDPSFIGLTHLIDALWGRWIEGDTDGLGRSRVLMRLGILEGDSLSTDVPRMQLDQSEQPALGTLAASGLVRIREERVRFSHDLLGDWARMRVLMGDQSLSSPAGRDRAILPRWHRAMRLFGQRLLEQSGDGPNRWQQAIEEVGDESQAASVVRDLFLESLFLATNAQILLERCWSALAANNGRLLNRMLNRFLFVATLPDPRIATLIQGEADAAQLQHLFRIPYWPYWGPLLSVLHARRADVAKLAPHNAANLCSLWLRVMPIELAPGEHMPWRQEAAELALAIGREIQTQSIEHNGTQGDKCAYEAVLWAAPELPEEVAAFCLELAQRRDLSPEIRLRVDQARERAREQRREWLAAHPERKQAPAPPSFFGRLRDPWLDGPRDRVDTAFQQACLDTAAFAALVQARPEAALEVLLAVCIEEPQREDYCNRSRPEYGVDYWRAGDPPLFCRGPFLQFLRQAPEQGLSFVLRLVNFATSRFAEGEGLTIAAAGNPRNWLGDSRVFRWHFDWPITNGSMIHSSLMALERWFYEQIDRGENIDRWLARILSESESLAFAGLLFDVGKRLPALFAGPLKPLFRNWILVDWDRNIAIMRQSGTGPLGYWGRQPARLIELGREWHGMPHRRDLLLYLGGGIVRTMMGEEEYSPFLQQVRAEWAQQLDAQRAPEPLRLLIERLNPANYKFEVQESKRIAVEFQWPEPLARQSAEDLRKLGERNAATSLPLRCRKCIDSGKPLPQDQLLWLWQFLQNIDTNPPQLPSGGGEPLLHMQDIVCGGIAVLAVLHHDWLAQSPERMTWCRRKLEAVLQRPPEPFRFDSEMASGEWRWASFAADAGVCLLAQDRNDKLARGLVAMGVLSYHYSTTARTLHRASQRREQLAEDFDRMLALAVRWAGLRPPYSLAARVDAPSEEWRGRKAVLIAEFADQRVPIELPDIQEVNAAAAADFDAVHAAQFPKLARRRGGRQRSRRHGRSRESLYPDTLSLDSHVLSAAFAWLDLLSAQPDERVKWLRYIRNFLAIVLASIPKVDDPQQQEIEGHPDEFDCWVFGLVARTIPCLSASEDPRSLWQPILDLGSPAHEWVERFFWDWFTDGVRAARSPTHFTALWTAMIQHSLASSSWDPAVNRSYDLSGMVFELLGFNASMNRLGLNPEFLAPLAAMENVFAAAAAKWFASPKIVAGFLYFAVQPAAAGLLLPAVKWLAGPVPTFDSYDWKYGLEDNLIAFLHTCWERESRRISNDPSLQSAFLSLLTCSVSRGGHAAIALRDRVVNSPAA